jgi:O-antigen/teichoic acid export membrane protein
MNAAVKSVGSYLGLLSGRSSIIERLAHGVFWVTTGTVAARVLSAISSILVARILQTTAYGELGMVQSTIELLVVAGTFRLGSTTAKYVSQYRATQPARAGAVLLLVSIVSIISCCTMTVLCLVSSPWMARHIMHRPDLAPVIALGAVLVFFSTFASIQEVALSGFEAFKATACVNIAQGLTSITLFAPLAALWGVRGVIVASTVGSAGTLAICLVVLRRECMKHRVPLKVPWRSVLAEASILWRFALPGVLAGLAVVGTMWMGKVILVRQAGGYTQLGLFSAANHWRTPMLFLSTVLCRVMLPLLSQAYSDAKTGDLKTAIGANLKIVCVTALPVCLVVMSFADLIQGIVFGDKFRDSAVVLKIVMPVTFLYAVDRVYERIFEGAGRRWADLGLTIGWGLVFLAVGVFTIPRFGGVGLPLALLFAYAALLICRIMYVECVLVPGTVRGHIPLLAFCMIALTLVYLGPSW